MRSLVQRVGWKSVIFDEGFCRFLAFCFEEFDEFKVLVYQIVFVVALVTMGVHEGGFLNK